uniref:PROP1-like PPR domain-containing protein n=1 Tax=Esox lucius TaxID=8010 RepID=A0A6Q2XHP1_ESOLU
FRLNMAALLRSARLLKCLPSGLLQTKGTIRNGPPLSRLYSGAIGGKGTGVSKDESSLGVRSKQAQQFDWALAKLDSSVRRTGRVTKTLLMRIFHDICRTGYPSGNQALLLLRSCGSLLPEVPMAERSELARHIWDKLKELGASYDASHYNALVKVFLQNEFKFSPNEFLAKMEAAGVPFTKNYHTILGFMKSKDLPITEAVFNSLVTGHARADDMESAVSILSVMKGAGIEPGPDTYVALLNAYAERGDMEKIRQTLETAGSTDISLMDRDLMQVVFSLAKAGYHQHVPSIVDLMRHERGYVPDAMNLCLSLITQGHEDTAFSVLKTFPTLQQENESGDSNNLGNFFLRHCVNMNKPVEKLARYCQELQDSNCHAAPLQFTLYCCLEAKNTATALELMKIMKEQGQPIRPHFFWPLLMQHVKDRNTVGVMEVMKGMQELGVPADVETLSNYILPAFPNVAVARDTFKVVCFCVHVTFLADKENVTFWEHLAGLEENQLELSLSAPQSHPPTHSHGPGVTFYVLVSISVSLLSTEGVSYFLYNLIDSMSEAEVQAQEEKLRQYFNQLKSMNIVIPVNIYRGIRNLLDSYHVPELIKVSSDSPTSRANGLGLERKLAELKAEGKPVGPTLKQLILSLCSEEKLDAALELKSQHAADMATGGYAALIHLCCRHNNVDEALKLKGELSHKDPSVSLDSTKSIALVKALVKHDRMEEAVDLLKEMKEKDVSVVDTAVTLLFHTLNAAALKGDVAAVRQLQATVFTLGLTKPTANLCSPLITAHLQTKDLSGALDAAMECQKQYGHLPRIHDVICGLVENGDTELLQKAMDFVSQERGEMTMLYNLFFAFMQTGRHREARKIIETPGLRARAGRLQWYAEKCVAANQMESLESLVEMTAKLFECDRDEMYHYLLRLCKNTNDWRKAEATWTKMQEENVIPRERTLRLLADILRSNGQEVPFEVIVKCSSYVSCSCLVCACRSLFHSSLCSEAYSELKNMDRKGEALGPSPYSALIRALLAEGNMEDALEVQKIATTHIPHFKLNDIANSLLIITQAKKNLTKDALATLKSMLQADQVPSKLSITRLVQSLGSHGDIAGIQDVEALMKGLGNPLNLSPMMFVNNTAIAHLDSAVEGLEAIYTSAGEGSQPASMAFVFRKVLEEKNITALDKLSAMAERLANHFASYGPASDLFIQLMDAGMKEEAKFMLARCSAVAEQREALVSYMSRLSRTPGQLCFLALSLLLILSFSFSLNFFDWVCLTVLARSTALDNDLASAKALYQQMQSEGVEADELCLKRLAKLYKSAGESVPFTEPPVSVCALHTPLGGIAVSTASARCTRNIMDPDLVVIPIRLC